MEISSALYYNMEQEGIACYKMRASNQMTAKGDFLPEKERGGAGNVNCIWNHCVYFLVYDRHLRIVGQKA
jgi:hypothetical protein